MSYKERCEAQLKAWVEGDSQHNQVDDECCPDFSCCVPNIQTSKEDRETFARIYRENQIVADSMKLTYLQQAFPLQVVEVTPNKKEQH